jgi:ribonucleotide monophosphatase NagD (HAD superfamily)
MPVEPERIRTALFAAGEILRARSWNATYLVAPEARADLPPEAPPETADAVLVGDCGRHFTFESLNRVLPALLGGKPLLAVHKNPYWMEDGAPTLDGGAFVAALEFAAGIEAEIVGKPSPPFFLAAAAGLLAKSEDPRSIVMVGDRWDTDVEGARAAGFSGLLVRTGLFRPGDEKRGAPDGILASVQDLPAWLEERGACGS